MSKPTKIAPGKDKAVTPTMPVEPSPTATSALLFEIAWEVCAQVGGIYTVLRSKAPATVRRWQDSYCLIGPWREGSARVELEPQAMPAGPLQDAVEELSPAGIRCHFGRWLITGRPQVLLIDLSTAIKRLAEAKYFLWEDHGISSSDGDTEFDEIVLFGSIVSDILRTVSRRAPTRAVLAHFHEWQGAAALPTLWKTKARVASVFTTHATLVGRALSAANVNLYDNLGAYDPSGVAHEHGFAHRYGLERAAAHAATIFSTVSGITAQEAEHFLARKPDVVLPNGLNVERFAAPHEFQVLHAHSKEKIHEFVMAHFFPSYTFDLDRTLYFFTAGRYEFRNKGLDVFIEALYELNRRMKADGATATVVAFIVTKAAAKNLNVQTVSRHAMFDELRGACESIKDEMGRRLFHTVAHGRLPTADDLLDEYAAVRLKRMMYAWRQGMPPTIVTHDLYDDAHDPVLSHLRHRGLWNRADDRVKVVFHPDFLSLTSPLLSMDYDHFVRGCHLGVFPSYYEPWGYTPLECIVRGVPAITSDYSGFGSYLMDNLPKHDDYGLFVARRKGKSFDAAVGQVVDWMYRLTRMSRRERIAIRNTVESRADDFDWNRLITHYVAAHEMALRNRFSATGLVPADPGHTTF